MQRNIIYSKEIKKNISALGDNECCQNASVVLPKPPNETNEKHGGRAS